MRCPVCGAADLVGDIRDRPFEYKGATTTIPAVAGDHCPACGEVVIDKADSARVSRLMNEFMKRVNGAAIDPIFVLATRRRLNLSQRQAGELLGGGPNAFSRYETGVAQPPRSTVVLLKLLDKHPELLAEIRAVAPT